MSKENLCRNCIGRDGNDCCIDVYIILNPDEVYLFKNYSERFKQVKDGGIYYTTQGCPYFHNNQCVIHQTKPLYCKYYPIFITGKPFIHDECSIHKNYQITKAIKEEISELQQIYPIYKREWYWEEVKKVLRIEI
ncbi:MAG: YkgJ family cysteine cluster protein [Promethearchaeota archaeon]